MATTELQRGTRYIFILKDGERIEATFKTEQDGRYQVDRPFFDPLEIETAAVEKIELDLRDDR